MQQGRATKLQIAGKGEAAVPKSTPSTAVEVVIGKNAKHSFNLKAKNLHRFAMRCPLG